MKKTTYVSPSIEHEELLVEQGIAMSIESNGFEDIYLKEETIEW